jgi:ataxia telangiectasia mutated family protein
MTLVHPIRYRPGDILPNICYQRLSEYRIKRKGTIIDPDDLRKFFVNMLRRFQPVFRHFFTERHKLPMAWFSTRLNYARSVATTSIVGHILGLGDRHVSNILIDNTTGELVHIDLGIAFDQVGLFPCCQVVFDRIARGNCLLYLSSFHSALPRIWWTG